MMGTSRSIQQHSYRITAENIAYEYNISREEMDRFALNSQNKAIAAVKASFKDK